MPDQVEEKILIEQLRSGSQQAFSRIYELYSMRLFGNILRMVRNADIAQDLLQQLFINVWEKRRQIDPEQSFSSYLFQISRNLVYNHFRHAKIETSVKNYLASIGSELHTEPEQWLAYRESKERLGKMIEQLPPQRRAVFTLCKIEGKSYEEVSGLLGISPSTISDHIVKATRFLKDQYREEALTMLLITGSLFGRL